MAKKKQRESYWLEILAVLAVALAIIVIVNATGILSSEEAELPIASGDTNVNVEVIVEEEGTPSSAETTTLNMCDDIKTNYPTGTFVKQLECAYAGGTYVCEADEFGCYDIPTGGFNETLCGADLALQLKAYCTTQSGVWTCNANDIRCEV